MATMLVACAIPGGVAISLVAIGSIEGIWWLALMGGIGLIFYWECVLQKIIG